MAGEILKGHAMAGLVLGAIELVLALIVIICSFVMAGKAEMSTSLTPYWAGIPFIIPGILGLVTGFTKNKCAMIAFMVLNILCFILQGLGTILVAIVVAIWAAYASAVDDCTKIGEACYCRVDGETKVINGMSNCDDLKAISTLLYVIVIFLVIGAIVTLAASILGCVATCCTSNATTTVIVQQPGMVMQVPPQQQQQQTYPMKQ
ncbi:membrane-spanning 4-domains subfamily A member 4D-like [Hydractinia symbiolongicarpus]|uniref:membrane-spanning 4-domains subfamily A member 4D-like n=1 Tax=Hydractinia symbiolongicarpus TaxID=13093 RepID=UPI00254BA774|nr:membrane-spanning 4-domains subfamily A member 4D-like [Hydractinia symbiolongicarpus]